MDSSYALWSKIYLILKTSRAAVALNISFCLLKLREFSKVNYGELLPLTMHSRVYSCIKR